MNAFAIDITMTVLMVLSLFSLYRTVEFMRMLSTATRLSSDPDVRKRRYNKKFDERVEREHLGVSYGGFPGGIAAITFVMILWIAFLSNVELSTEIIVTATLIITWQISRILTFNFQPLWLVKGLASLLIANAQNDLELINQDIEKVKQSIKNFETFVVGKPVEDEVSEDFIGFVNQFAHSELDHLITVRDAMTKDLEDLTETEQCLAQEYQGDVYND